MLLLKLVQPQLKIEIGTRDGQRMLCLDFTVDASKLPNQLFIKEVCNFLEITFLLFNSGYFVSII